MDRLSGKLRHVAKLARLQLRNVAYRAPRLIEDLLAATHLRISYLPPHRHRKCTDIELGPCEPPSRDLGPARRHQLFATDLARRTVLLRLHGVARFDVVDECGRGLVADAA